jgi:hypothetical protein
MQANIQHALLLRTMTVPTPERNTLAVAVAATVPDVLASVVPAKGPFERDNVAELVRIYQYNADDDSFTVTGETYLKVVFLGPAIPVPTEEGASVGGMDMLTEELNEVVTVATSA